jgi:hypothetical protein
MKKILLFALLLTLSILNAIIITGPKGDSLIYSYTDLAKIPRETFTTTRVKSGEIQEDVWTGFRFNRWLNENIQIPYKIIRFESADNYMVSFSKAEFDSLECWLAFTQNGQPLPDNGLRLIFPQLRDMKWIRGLERIVLEDFSPLKLPVRFEFLDKRLKKETLIDNPPPFTDTKGYYFADLLPLSARKDTHSVVLYSSDGIKCSLEYPRHLDGAIIELTDYGFSLKSPSIPDGMWLKDIIYLQIDDWALIKSDNLDALITLNRIMDWKLSPDVQFIVNIDGKEEKIPLSDVLSHPDKLADINSFELIP